MARKSTQTSEPMVSSTGQAAASAPAKKHRSSRAQARPAAETEGSTAAIASLAQAVSPVAEEEIARLAYSYWEERGRQGGSPEEDWLRAERELRATAAAAAE